LGINDAAHDKGKQRQRTGQDGDDQSDEGNYTWKQDRDRGNNNGARESVDSENTRATGSKSSSSKNPIKMYKDYRSRSRDLHRKQRGLMQW
jgi:hypothetical protein